MEENEFIKANNKLIYDTMLDIHIHIFEQQKYAEIKNNIILTISLAILIVYVRLFFIAKDSLLNNTIFLMLFLIPLVPLIVSLCSILQSFKPHLSNKEKLNNKNQDEPCIQPNIYYFGYICKIKSDDLIREVKSKIDCKNISNMEQIKDLANQIHILSDITTRKYQYFNKAMCWLERFIWIVIGICMIFCIFYFIEYIKIILVEICREIS